MEGRAGCPDARQAIRAPRVMPTSPERRREINQQNARKSTGPKSPEGKRQARGNALKHGLRAAAIPLPGEDQAEVAGREHEWVDYYRPVSPAAKHLVAECVRATLLADRCHRHHAASLAEQVRTAEPEWHERRSEEVRRLAAEFKTDPVSASRQLVKTAEGCSWMIGRWERLAELLDRQGRWGRDDCEEAIGLQGLGPKPSQLHESPAAWLTWLSNLACDEECPAESLHWILRPDIMPSTLRGQYREDWLPDPASALRSLKELVVERLDRLRGAEEDLWDGQDRPSLEGAADRALILRDAEAARLFLRYQAESRNAFHRAYGQLVKTLSLDADAEGDDSPNEANSDGSSRVEAPGESSRERLEEVGQGVLVILPTTDGTGVERFADLTGARGSDGPVGPVEIEAVRVPVQPHRGQEASGVAFKVVDHPLVFDVDDRRGKHLAPVLREAEVRPEPGGDVTGIIAPEDTPEVAHPAGEGDVSEISMAVNHGCVREEGDEQAQKDHVIGHLVDDPLSGSPREGVESFHVGQGEATDGRRVQGRNAVNRRLARIHRDRQVREHPTSQRKLSRAQDVGMTGQHLLDQRGSRPGQADHEDGAARLQTGPRDPLEEVSVEDPDQVVVEPLVVLGREPTVRPRERKLKRVGGGEVPGGRVVVPSRVKRLAEAKVK